MLQEVSNENKLRLLMIYAAIHPDKFEGDKGVKLMQVCDPCKLMCEIHLFVFL